MPNAAKKLMGCAGGNLKVLNFTFHVRFWGFVLQLVGFFCLDVKPKNGQKKHLQRSFPFVKFFQMASEKNDATVDGRNPAPVDMYNIPLFIGFYTSQVVSPISAINRIIPTMRLSFQFWDQTPTFRGWQAP